MYSMHSQRMHSQRMHSQRMHSQLPARTSDRELWLEGGRLAAKRAAGRIVEVIR